MAGQVRLLTEHRIKRRPLTKHKYNDGHWTILGHTSCDDNDNAEAHGAVNDIVIMSRCSLGCR